MLYYTFTWSGLVEGTYNGRFAFVHCRDRKEVEALKALREEDNYRALWRQVADGGNETIQKLSRIVLHELAHKLAYSRSPAGLVLNGWRWWACVRFLLLRSDKAVKDYYRARAVYFQETSDLQERIVKRLEEEAHEKILDSDTVSRIIDQEYADTITDADRSVTEKWRELKLAPGGLAWKSNLESGIRLHRDFSTAVSFFDDNGEYASDWIADSGIFGDISAKRARETAMNRLMKRCLRNLRLEPLSKRQTLETDLRWFLLGQSTERTTLIEHYGVKESDFRQERVGKMLPFIMRWAGVPLGFEPLTAELTDDALEMTEKEFYQKWWGEVKEMREPHPMRRYFNFYYLHGN